MDANLVSGSSEENRERYIISKYIPTRYFLVLITKEKEHFGGETWKISAP